MGGGWHGQGACLQMTGALAGTVRQLELADTLLDWLLDRRARCARSSGCLMGNAGAAKPPHFCCCCGADMVGGRTAWRAAEPMRVHCAIALPMVSLHVTCAESNLNRRSCITTCIQAVDVHLPAGAGAHARVGGGAALGRFGEAADREWACGRPCLLASHAASCLPGP